MDADNVFPADMPDDHLQPPVSKPMVPLDDDTAERLLAGHLHPVGKVVMRGRAVRRRSFVTDGERCLLPALGAYWQYKLTEDAWKIIEAHITRKAGGYVPPLPGRCGNCGAVAASGSAFCSTCGADLRNRRAACPACGGLDLETEGGDELILEAIQLEEANVSGNPG